MMNARATGKAVAEKTAKIPNGMKMTPKGLVGSYQRFAGVIISPDAPVNAKTPKLKAMGTMGKLKAFLVDAIAKGQSNADIAEHFGCSPARISELVVIFSIERPEKPKVSKKEFAAKMKAARDKAKASKAKKAPKAKVEGEGTYSFPKGKTSKPVDQGDEGEV